MNAGGVEIYDGSRTISCIYRYVLQMASVVGDVVF
jgi:hypothetical protein